MSVKASLAAISKKRLTQRSFILKSAILFVFCLVFLVGHFDVGANWQGPTWPSDRWHLGDLLIFVVGILCVALLLNFPAEGQASRRHGRLMTELREAMPWSRYSTPDFVEELSSYKATQSHQGTTAVFMAELPGEGVNVAAHEEVLQVAALHLEALVGEGRVSYFRVYGKQTRRTPNEAPRRSPVLVHPAWAERSRAWLE